MVLQEKHPDRVSVYLDGAFGFGLHQDLVLRYDLYKGKSLSEADVARIKDADQEFLARGKAYHFIGYRPRTVQEVRRRLQRAGHQPEHVARVVEHFLGLGLLDDAAFARDYVQSRMRNKGYGPDRIRNELLRKGVDRTLIDETLREVLADVDTVEAVRAAADKQWGRLRREPDSRKRIRKLYEYLLRRGHTTDDVRRVIEEFRSRER